MYIFISFNTRKMGVDTSDGQQQVEEQCPLPAADWSKGGKNTIDSHNLVADD